MLKKKINTQYEGDLGWIAYCEDETDGEPQLHGRGFTKEEAIQDYINQYGDKL